MKLSDIIKNYIEEHNYTVRGFADICGISSSQMSLMARGINSSGNKSIPEPKTLEKLAAGMGIGYRELLSVMDDNALLHYRKQKRHKKSPPRREGVLTTGRREPVTKPF